MDERRKDRKELMEGVRVINLGASSPLRRQKKKDLKNYQLGLRKRKGDISPRVPQKRELKKRSLGEAMESLTSHGEWEM